MNAVITVGSITLVIIILLLSSFSPYSFSQAEGQILFSCPNGYQHNSLGLCEPLANLGPNLTCPDEYNRNPSGVCESIGGTSSPINNATNQTRSSGSSVAQRPPNTGGAFEPLQQPQLPEQQPLPLPMQQQQPFVQSQPQLAIPSPPLSLQVPTPLPTNPLTSPSYSIPYNPPLTQSEEQEQRERAILLQQQNWSSYEDPILGISIDYPAWYEVEERENHVKFYSFGSNQDADTFMGLIVLEPLPENIDTNENFMQYRMKESRGSIDKIHEMNGNITLAGKPAYKLDSSREGIDYVNGSRLEGSHRTDYFIVNNGIQVITYL
jgi:hypothetical protein